MLVDIISANSSRCRDGILPLMQHSILRQLLASWLLPGSGHILSGRKNTGIWLLLAINGLWILGMWLSNFEASSKQFHPWLFWVGTGCGSTLVLSWFEPASDLALRGLATVQKYQDVPKWNDTGALLVYCAGLLNLLSCLDLLDASIDPSRREAPAAAEENAP